MQSLPLLIAALVSSKVLGHRRNLQRFAVMPKPLSWPWRKASPGRDAAEDMETVSARSSQAWPT
jgi:hypothetical protein